MCGSVSTTLMYGYDLGGGEGEWSCIPYDRENYAHVWPGWMELDDKSDPEYPVPEDFIAQCSERLTEILTHEAGFTEPEPDWEADTIAWRAWRTLLHEAKKAVQVDCGEGSLEFCPYGLDAWVMGIELASGDSLLALPPLAPWLGQAYKGHQEWDARLAQAVSILEITPAVKKPQLLVVASYG